MRNKILSFLLLSLLLVGYVNIGPVPSTGGGGTGILTLNTLTADPQFFANDTNVTMVSSVNTHTLTWSGLLGVTRGGTGVSSVTGLVLGNGASAFSAYAGSLCSNQFFTALSSDGVPTCTTLVLNSGHFQNQGTTTTLLHGNAAGFPSWGSVVNTDLNLSAISCTNQLLSALSSSLSPTCTSLILSSGQFSNQGTTTTVLHGNAGGNPIWSSIVNADLNVSAVTCSNQFLRSLSSTLGGTCATVATTDVVSALISVSKSITIDAPTTGASNKIQWEFPSAITVSEIVCSTDTGTVTIQFDERARVTPNTAGTNVLTSSLVCDSDSQASTTFSNAGIAADVPLNLQITAVASTPGVVRIHFQYTTD